MAKGSSIHENMKVESMELFIIESLLKGENVVIPDFGYLELKTLGERRTVLFKSSNNEDSFLRVMSAYGEKEKDAQALNTVISTPLKEEKTVTLPQVGVFRPIKRENGEIHISFTPSSSLRKLLNENGDKVEEKMEEIKAAVKEEVEEVKAEIIPAGNKDEVQKVAEVVNKINEAGKNEQSEIKTLPIRNNDETLAKFRTPGPSFTKKEPLTTKVIESQQREDAGKSRWKNIIGILLITAAIIILLLIGVSLINSHQNKKKINDPVELVLPNESINLPSLAKQHYGNSAFWIYIYEANLDKLTSPVNIPANVSLTSLVIPDLRTEYGIENLTDSAEIQKANRLADNLLKKKIINNNNN